MQEQAGGDNMRQVQLGEGVDRSDRADPFGLGIPGGEVPKGADGDDEHAAFQGHDRWTAGQGALLPRLTQRLINDIPRPSLRPIGQE